VHLILPFSDKIVYTKITQSSKMRVDERIFVRTILSVMAGRPKSDQGARRNLEVRIRVTAEERERFHKAAISEGLDLSAWARRLLMKAAPVKKP
jgi:hypothetical protein